MASKNLETFITQRLFWLGQSGFKILSNSGFVLYLDPFEVPVQSDPADLILVSHPHRDHCNYEAMERLKKNLTVIVAPEKMAKKGLRGLTPGKTIEIGPVKVTGVPAYNVKKKFHPKVQQWLGYLVEVDGIQIYHAGDTDCIPEMKELRPDIALLPMGGLFTMNVKGALEAVELIKPQIVVPMHYGFLPGTKGAGRKFAKMWSGVTKVLTPLK
ncbi:MAG TPA: MBL fold metallo-hydrolase [Bacillota bacterium]|nr:MBL fold metallo-hydrolase [Bacillota bacterium]